MKLTITQEDIDAGEKCHTGNCPIAMSLKRVGFKNALVGMPLIFLGYGKSVQTNKTQRRFINRFDKGLPVKPFTTVLRGVK